MTRWCPSYSCRYDCIFVNVETKIMAKDEENIMIILVLLSFLAVNQPTYRILREGYFIANTRMLNLLKILRHLKKDYLSIILKPSIACVQTSPLPREKKKSGEETCVQKSLLPIFSWGRGDVCSPAKPSSNLSRSWQRVKCAHLHDENWTFGGADGTTTHLKPFLFSHSTLFCTLSWSNRINF